MFNSAMRVRYTFYTTPRRVTRRLRVVTPETVSQPRAILVCDSATQAERWCVALGLRECEVLCVTDVAQAASCTTALLAVVDVAPENLVETLKALRMNPAQEGLHIFVAADRVVNEPELAGVLPQHRAMPCGQSELIQLVRRRLNGTSAPTRKEFVL